MDNKFNIFFFAVLVFTHLNYSISLVQYKRFKNERKLAIRSCQKHSSIFRKYEDFKFMPLDNNLTIKIDERERRICLLSKLIKNISLMLEYNKNGLMHLLIYIIQLFILALQFIKACFYANLPTVRDPTTGEFQDPWLRFCEQIYLIDFSYMIGMSSMFNQMHLVLCSQFLILRLRNLYLRMQTSIINECKYEKLNILETNVAFISELRLTFREWLQLFKEAISHQCEDNRSFSGQSRLNALKWHEKLKGLTRIDRLYYHNMIDFSDCFKKIDPLEDYDRRTQLIEQSDGFLYNLEEKKVSRIKYIFSIDLPDRVEYVAKPYHRLDLKCLNLIIALYIIANVGTFLVVMIASLLGTNIAIFYEDPDATYSTALTKLFGIRYAIAISNLFVIVIVYALNTYDNALLALSSIITLSRSKKIIRLLKLERSFCHRQYLNFQKLSDEFKSNLNKQSDAFETRLKQFNLYLLQIKGEQNLDYKEFKLSVLDQFNSHDVHKSSLYYKHTMPEEDFKTKLNNKSNEFHHMSLIYKNCLCEEKISELNENLDYIMDLIVTLQSEFDDLKSILTTPLNINIIFGTIGSSITVAMILDSNDLQTLLMSSCIGSASVVPLILALYAGATNEKAVSVIYPLVISLMNLL